MRFVWVLNLFYSRVCVSGALSWTCWRCCVSGTELCREAAPFSTVSSSRSNYPGLPPTLVNHIALCVQEHVCVRGGNSKQSSICLIPDGWSYLLFIECICLRVWFTKGLRVNTRGQADRLMVYTHLLNVQNNTLCPFSTFALMNMQFWGVFTPVCKKTRRRRYKQANLVHSLWYTEPGNNCVDCVYIFI